MSAEFVAHRLGQAHLSSSGWWRCRCPKHGSAGSTLAVRDTPRGLVVHCHAGCGRDDILAELQRLGVLDDSAERIITDPAEIERQRESKRRNRAQRIAAALDFWNHDTVPATGTVIEHYWKSRGLGELPIPVTLRLSRSWPRHPEGGSRPAMVALVEHVEHGPVAVHRTFLAIDGSSKSSFRSPRLSLGPTGGAAVRLADAGEMLVVAEGIETAASVMLATGLPAWVALSASGMERLVLQPLPTALSVIIAADHDRNGVGERAARLAAGRWLAEGRRVRITLPPEPGSDFNDLLRLTEARHAAA